MAYSAAKAGARNAAAASSDAALSSPLPDTASPSTAAVAVAAAAAAVAVCFVADSALSDAPAAAVAANQGRWMASSLYRSKLEGKKRETNYRFKFGKGNNSVRTRKRLSNLSFRDSEGWNPW